MAKKAAAAGSAVRGSKTGRPIMALLDLLGRRWALRILWELREDALTSRALRAACDDASLRADRPRQGTAADEPAAVPVRRALEQEEQVGLSRAKQVALANLFELVFISYERGGTAQRTRPWLDGSHAGEDVQWFIGVPSR
jgi:hypothetical protein